MENSVLHSFHVTASDERSAARAGEFVTARGTIRTPVFMPVGTQGSVKIMDVHELKTAGAQIILGNTYHLYLRPGHTLIEEMGELHRFIGWDRAILTDSGGYQLMSLADLRTLDRDGAVFRSHLDGSTHRFTPEGAMEIQAALGSDIAMVFDECTPFPCDESTARRSAERTLEWAKRCSAVPMKPHQARFGIVQGSIYPEIRRWHAHALRALPFEGFAVGGLAVGEPREQTFDAVGTVIPELPINRPRYLMGLGLPQDLLDGIERGADMFDCVIPTRNGRRGTAYTSEGKLVIKNAQFARDERPLDEDCACLACRTYSRAYLRHLFASGELLGSRLVSLHNVTFFIGLVNEAREAIIRGEFLSWKRNFLENYSRRSDV